MLEWPLCAVCFVFCSVLSLFHLRICFSLRLFLFCQGRRHFSRVTSYWARYFFFGRKIFVGHLVRHTGVFCRTFWKNVRLSDKSDEFRQHCDSGILCNTKCNIMSYKTHEFQIKTVNFKSIRFLEIWQMSLLSSQSYGKYLCISLHLQTTKPE